MRVGSSGPLAGPSIYDTQGCEFCKSSGKLPATRCTFGCKLQSNQGTPLFMFELHVVRFRPKRKFWPEVPGFDKRCSEFAGEIRHRATINGLEGSPQERSVLFHRLARHMRIVALPNDSRLGDVVTNNVITSAWPRPYIDPGTLFRSSAEGAFYDPARITSVRCYMLIPTANGGSLGIKAVLHNLGAIVISKGKTHRHMLIAAHHIEKELSHAQRREYIGTEMITLPLVATFRVNSNQPSSRHKIMLEVVGRVDDDVEHSTPFHILVNPLEGGPEKQIIVNNDGVVWYNPRVVSYGQCLDILALMCDNACRSITRACNGRWFYSDATRDHEERFVRGAICTQLPREQIDQMISDADQLRGYYIHVVIGDGLAVWTQAGSVWFSACLPDDHRDYISSLIETCAIDELFSRYSLSVREGCWEYGLGDPGPRDSCAKKQKSAPHSLNLEIKPSTFWRVKKKSQ